MFSAKNKMNRVFLLFALLFFLSLFLTFFSSTVLAGDTFGIQGVENEINLSSTDPRTIATKIINVALGFLSIIAVIIVIYGGFVWMTSNGEEDRIDKAKKTLKAGVIGLIIILASWGIASFVLNKLGEATGIGSGILCEPGSVVECDCDGSKTCGENGRWGDCIGSSCNPGSPGSYCSSNPFGTCVKDNGQCNPGLFCNDDCKCQEVPCGTIGQDGVCAINVNINCPSGYFCSENSCTCTKETDNDGEFDDPCGSIDDNICSPDNADCNLSHGLICDQESCTCQGNPVITKISPIGGFCENNNDLPCSTDSACNNSTCNLSTPNTTAGNFITILGYNFGSYSASSSSIKFIERSFTPEGEENVVTVEGQNPGVLSSACVNFWSNDQIIIAMPTSTPFLSGKNLEVEVITAAGRTDNSQDNFGPIINLKYNNIVRPGLCQLSNASGKMNDELNYYGINLLDSQAYFGNESNNIPGFLNNSIYNNISARVPNLSRGRTTTFAQRNSVSSNFLDFEKLAEDPQGPSISFFDPTSGSAGQYISIYGSGFYNSRGNSQVYFKDSDGATTSADFSFPDVCLQSIWSNSQVLIKVPSGLNDGDYHLAMKIRDWPEAVANGIFTVSSGLALKPSLCKISPSFGPINSSVSLWGEYFGTSSRASFNFNKNTDFVSVGTENQANKISVRVPEASITGPVKVKRSDDNTGNSLNFIVGICSGSSDCPDNSNHCCQVGTSRAGSCVASEQECMSSTTPFSLFQWKFTTGFATSTFNPNNIFSCSSYAVCPTDNTLCPNSLGVCSPNSSSSSCDCCCDKTANSSDGNPGCCPIPGSSDQRLSCGDSCGNKEEYGLCVGCKISDVTSTSTRDNACNCPENDGKYCLVDSNHGNGACVDCTSLDQSGCREHSAACCWDGRQENGEGVCRGGKSDSTIWGESSTNIGLCPYYKCNEIDTTVCDKDNNENPIPDPNGEYSSPNICKTGCAQKCNQVLGSGIFNSCLNSGAGCCWKTSISPGEGAYSSSGICQGGSRYRGEGDYQGLCIKYNCTENSTCSSTPFGSYGENECSSAICRLNQPNSPGASCKIASSSSNLCSTNLCFSPFDCLSLPSDLDRCGFCCCDPRAETDVCSQVNVKLSCFANKGNCSGSDRGLCCGCSSDSECGNQATAGCGSDTCCYARPTITAVSPLDKADNICRNAGISISFDQRMAADSIEGNILLLEENTGVCPSGTYSIVAQADDVQTEGFWAVLKNIFVKPFNYLARIFTKNVVAAPDSNKNYCAVLGLLEIEQGVDGLSTVNFYPDSLLKAETRYFIVVKGDKELDSQSGVKNYRHIGFNGPGYRISLGYIESDADSNIKFNNIYFKNSQIFEFKTLSVNAAGSGVCVIDQVSVSPSSYLFQRLENDNNENDINPLHETFNSVRDEDTAFYAQAYSSGRQKLVPSSQYNWTWSWSIDNNQKVAFKNVNSWSEAGSRRLLGVKPGVTSGEAKVEASVVILTGSYTTVGNGTATSADVYILDCDKPWPAVQQNGIWLPWEDKSLSGVYSSYNYKLYYCRDAGQSGPEEDLPAFSESSIINRGVSATALNKVCTNNPTQACNEDEDCPARGFCLSSFLKETYFFRDESTIFDTENIFTLRYYCNSDCSQYGSIEGSSLTQQVYMNGSGSTVIAVPRYGYAFERWSDGVLNASRTDEGVSSSIEVSPIFSPQSYQVIFEATTGGTISGSTTQSIIHGGNASLVIAIPNPGYHFSGWRIDGTFDNNHGTQFIKEDVTRNLDIEAVFLQDIYHNLFYGSESGGFLQLNSGLTTSSYAVRILKGRDGPPITARPNTGNSFTNWSDGQNSDNRMDLNVDSDINVTACFSLNNYTLNYSANTGGTINGVTTQTVPHGESGTEVEAAPSPGYHFVKWSDNETRAIRTDSNITANKSFQANFQQNEYELEYSISAVAGCSATLNGASSQVVLYGGNGSAVEVVPSPGCCFTKWNDNNTQQIRTDINVTNDITVSAIIEKNKYKVCYHNSNIAHGKICRVSDSVCAMQICFSDINHGSDVPDGVIVTPEFGHTFINWSDGLSDNPRTDRNITSDIEFTAWFTGSTYTLNYSANTGGTISGNTTQTVPHGGSSTLVTAIPNPGYRFVSWSDDNTTAARTDSSVIDNIDVSATFIQTHTLSYSFEGRGSLNGSLTQVVDHGGNGSTVTATNSDPCCYFTKWDDNDSTIPARTDTDVTSNINAKALFGYHYYTLKYLANTGGAIDGITTQSVRYGLSGSEVRAVPNAGYKFVKWSDNDSTDPIRTDTGVTANITATASFVRMYSLKYISGAGGTIRGNANQSIPHSSSGTEVEAIPNTGYHFVNWSDNKTTATRTDSNITSDLTYTANFQQNEYSLIYNPSSGDCSATLDGVAAQTVLHGGNGSTVKVNLSSGCGFVKWSDNDSTNPIRTDTDVTASITTTPIVERINYGISLRPGLNGELCNNGTCFAAITNTSMGYYGGSYTSPYIVKPNLGYTFIGWSNGKTDNPYFEQNVTSNVSATAMYATTTYSLTYYVEGSDGIIDGVLNQTVSHGGSGTQVTAIPDSGYVFAGWSDQNGDPIRIDSNITADASYFCKFRPDSSYTFNCGDDIIYQGENYPTVQIGSQCWMKKNLNIGTRINALSSQANNSIIEKYCYNNNESNCDIYGGLYQWDEAMQYISIANPQGICPEGWHIPLSSELTTLTTYLGGSSTAGGKMKEAGTSHWVSPNTGATNESGFSALPAGYREKNGNLYSLFSSGRLWSSSLDAASNRANSCILYYDSTTAGIGLSGNSRYNGHSLRCLKN